MSDSRADRTDERSWRLTNGAVAEFERAFGDYMARRLDPAPWISRVARARVSGINEHDSASRSSDTLRPRLPRMAAIKRPTTTESMTSAAAPIANQTPIDIMITVSAAPADT